MRLGRSFFQRPSPVVARELLGSRLVSVLAGKRLSGIVVETEAYGGSRDPASHAYRGRTKRNEVMFGAAGHAYVYFTMGAHYCLNVTTEPEGTPAAVLIRAVEPVEGVELMKRNRAVEDPRRVASGPGNLTRAMGIDKAFNGEDMVRSERLFLERGREAGRVAASSRVGISKGTSFRWRFYLAGNPFVSKGRPSVKPQNP